jgi:hypothetical protein
VHYPDAKVYDKQATGPEAICKPPALLVRSDALVTRDFNPDDLSIHLGLTVHVLVRIVRGRASKIGIIEFILIRLGCVLQRLTTWFGSLQVIDILHPGRPNVPKVSCLSWFPHPLVTSFYSVFAAVHFLDGMSRAQGRVKQR